MALNISNQPNIPTTKDATKGITGILATIKQLFISPMSIIIVILALLGQYFFDWWTIALAAFIGAFVFAKSSGQAFATGTSVISTIWLLAAWFHHFSTNGILSSKIAYILPFGGNTGLLIFATVFIGGLVGGWAAMSGYLIRNLIRN